MRASMASPLVISLVIDGCQGQSAAALAALDKVVTSAAAAPSAGSARLLASLCGFGCCDALPRT